MTFSELELLPQILEALEKEQYLEPTPIQAAAIPAILDGRDVLATAQTGTGKTAAFALPMLQILSKRNPGRGKRPIKALILTPTRELAIQIDKNFKTYGEQLSVRNAVIFGGVSQRPQEQALAKGVDILVATPGRLVDLIGQNLVHIGEIDILVLDEADRMLDMGFIHDVKRILKLTPKVKQTLFFSATMPHAVTDLANSLLNDPVRVAIKPEVTTVEAIDQSVYMVRDKAAKRELLIELLANRDLDSVLIFTRTKHGADRIVKDLRRENITAAAIHGNKSQNVRVRALDEFKSHEIRVLVATDIAARGIDIDRLSYVINYDLPDVPESYVHRIGRTGRAGRDGIAIAFCDQEETKKLRDIERFIGQKVPVASLS